MMIYDVYISDFSDISILLANAEEIPAHRFILKSRSSEWGVPDLDATLMLGKLVYS